MNFSRLQQYGMYGAYNTWLNIPSTTELKEMDPQKLVDMIKALKGYKHEVLYYGPMELDKLVAAIDKNQKAIKTLADVPAGKPYKMQETTQTRCTSLRMTQRTYT